MEAVLLVIQLLLVLMPAINGVDFNSTVRLMQLGDWGGDENGSDGYATPAQIATANAMGALSDKLHIQGILALGDNFYYHGIEGACNINTCSERFNLTYVDVYNATSLQVPWYVISGNHDWYGNVSAQIEYSKVNPNWIYPNYYHKTTLQSDDQSVSVDIILIDTILFTGVDSGDGDTYPPSNVDPVQYNFIVDALKQSKADYILVGGHYPAYSVCAHGNTRTIISDLVPLLEEYGAHYLSGHDHCAEYFYSNNVAYVLNGMGHGCCYHNISEDIPTDSLKYFIANTDPSTNIDDDNYEVGVDGTVGSFTTIVMDKDSMNITFYNQDNEILYQGAPILPRSNNADNADNADSASDSMSQQTLIIIISVCVVFLLGLAVVNRTILNGLKKSSSNDECVHQDSATSNPINHNQRK